MTADQVTLGYYLVLGSVAAFALVAGVLASNVDKIDRLIASLEAEKAERQAKPLSCQVWGRG